MSTKYNQNASVQGGSINPFRVTWSLSQPVCLSENRLHLDSLLAWAKVDEAIKNGIALKEALAQQEMLPLRRAGDSENWIWKASSLLFTFSMPPFLVQCTRRTEVDKMAFARERLIRTGRTKISQGTGAYKDFDLRLTVQWVQSVVAYGVGDIKEVSRLLSSVRSLGKVTRNGWGRIAGYSITEDPEGNSHWRMRTLPTWCEHEKTEWHCPGFATVRPPYWRREKQEPVLEFIGYC